MTTPFEVTLELTVAGMLLLVDDQHDDVVHLIAPDTAHHGRHRMLLLAEDARHNRVLDARLLDFRTIASAAAPRPDVRGTRSLTVDQCTDPPAGVLDRALLSTTSFSPKLAAHVILQGGTLHSVKPYCFEIHGRKFPGTPSALRWRWTVESTGTVALPDARPRNGTGAVEKGPVIPVSEFFPYVRLALCFVPDWMTPRHPADLDMPLGAYDPSHLDAYRPLWTPSPTFVVKPCAHLRPPAAPASTASDAEPATAEHAHATSAVAANTYPFICPVMYTSTW